jgi:transketolase
LGLRRPTALILTRQNLPVIDRTRYATAAGAQRGGYVLWDSEASPQLILIATGSEVHICLQAAETLAKERVRVRVVSLPSWELFEMQDERYRNSVLPPHVAVRIAVEAGVSQGWERYLGPAGRFIGMNSFGASAPYEALYEHFGITADAVLSAARELLGRSG